MALDNPTAGIAVVFSKLKFGLYLSALLSPCTTLVNAVQLKLGHDELSQTHADTGATNLDGVFASADTV